MKAHAHDAGGCTEGAASAVGRASRVLALSLFLASLVAAVAGCRAMAAMGGLPMRGGWLLSAMWLRMCGQTWPGAAAAFLGVMIKIAAAMFDVTRIEGWNAPDIVQIDLTRLTLDAPLVFLLALTSLFAAIGGLWLIFAPALGVMRLASGRPMGHSARS